MSFVDPAELQALKSRQNLLENSIAALQIECGKIDQNLSSLIQKNTPIPQPKTSTTPPIPQPEPQILSSTPKPPQPEPGKSTDGWELNLGKIWFVRIGILSLLTGLVFLSTYAYQNWLAHATAPIKLSAFMIFSLLLTAAGMIFEKKKQDLVQYGRVITAGGLAAAYYTIYASHFVSSLKVIHSPALAATALTIWAGIMLLYACWKQSRTIAAISLGLAFYATIMNPTGWLSIFSALLLSTSGIFLLLRYHWTSIGIATLIAAYISHAIWLGIYPNHDTETVRFAYLACYWTLFSSALTFPAIHKISSKILHLFAAINNGATWTLAAFILPSFTPHPHIGEISIAYGALLLTLALLANHKKILPPALSPTYAYQGIFVVTLGIIITTTGYARFLVLAAEACLLIAAGHKHKNGYIKLASAPVYAIALISSVSFTGLIASWPPYLALALISTAYTILVRRTNNHPSTNNAALAIIPATNTWLIISFGIVENCPRLSPIPALLIIALTVAAAHKFLPRLQLLRDLALLTPLPVIIATAWQIDNTFTNPHLIIALTIPALIAAYWFLTPHIHNLLKNTLQYQSFKLPSNENPLGWIIGIITTLTVFLAFDQNTIGHNPWIILSGIIAITLHLISDHTKRISLTVPALILHPIAIHHSLHTIMHPTNILWIPATLIIIHLALTETILKSINKSILRPIFTITFYIAILIPIALLTENPETTIPVTFTLLTIATHLFANQKQDLTTNIIATTLALLIADLTAVTHFQQPTLITYIPIATALLIHASPTLKHIRNPYWKIVQRIPLIANLILLFTTLTAHIAINLQGNGLTIAWSILALTIFSLGLALNFKSYRYAGLTFLTFAITRLIFIDVMKFETLGRILAFITLGIILITLGYLYNRFQYQIKKFL